jgi:putative heme-binding domain-containing protein
MTARRRTNLLASFALFLFAAMPMLSQGQRNGPDAGAQQFARNCAGCHGADGRGGDKAPAIATIPLVVALSDADLIKIVHDGTQAGMPAFPQLGDTGIRAVVDYLRILQGKTPSNAPAAAVIGDSNSGHTLFFGKAQCSSCHMVNGVGGFIASDLTVYGQSHNEAAIIKAIVTPDNPLVPTARVVEVRTKSGQKLSGVVRSEDNFTLEMQTQDGRYHLLARNTLADVEYTDHSLMPHDYGTRLTPTELNDIASYLIVTGKAAPPGPPARGRRGGGE